ncbi:MAG: hypothetical protein JNK05_28060 [Myxococcales bacterium]|nr:hypothetical protein [Myxococcales bacterium]
MKTETIAALAVAVATHASAARAQAPAGAPPPTDARAPTSRHSIEASVYLHQLVHPGAQVGYSYRLLSTADEVHSLIVGVDVGTYVWLRHSIGVFVLPRVGYRLRTPGGFHAEVNMHAGYLQGVLASESFDVVDGAVVASGRAGYPYAYLGPSAGVGYAIRAIRVTPFARIGVQWQLPVFDQSLMRLVAAVGAEVAFR